LDNTFYVLIIVDQPNIMLSELPIMMLFNRNSDWNNQI